jgi:uncharacterized Zn finger protein (UPF0148 family)
MQPKDSDNTEIVKICGIPVVRRTDAPRGMCATCERQATRSSDGPGVFCPLCILKYSIVSWEKKIEKLDKERASVLDRIARIKLEMKKYE